MLGNCSTIISFRVGAKDAPIIAEAIDTAPQNLMDLGRRKAYMRTLVHDAPTEGMYIETRKARLPTGMMQRNVVYTRSKFARSREMVERALNPYRLRRSQPRRTAW